ncbi:hypothetical protein VKT23_016370 [Stygiomarasmius scandens]|uniref:Uncharacterized protein n=1 Tax=Marasmiellus scandens TaxID=2682957 RepID=A0ABR1IWB4_9AGAR
MKAGGSAALDPAPKPNFRSSKPAKKRRKVKKDFNLFTYKLHALADYADCIRKYGTTDNYSTQTGEQEHRLLKVYYARTNRHNFTIQISKHARHRRLQKIGQRKPNPKRRLFLQNSDDDPLPATNPNRHYHMSESQRYPVPLDKFLSDNFNDEAVHDFLYKLCTHLFIRLGHAVRPEDVSAENRNSVVIAGNKIYEHKILRVNFTAYDR